MTTLQFPGLAPAAKARPRVTSRGTFMPHDYRRWRAWFAMIARGQWLAVEFTLRPALTVPVAVAITYRTTTGNMRPDVDNAAGACLDGLQEAGIIANDSQVRRLLVEVVRAKKPDCGITVTVEPLPASPQRPAASPGRQGKRSPGVTGP